MFPLSTRRGSYKTAQGNALGKIGWPPVPCPERAKQCLLAQRSVRQTGLRAEPKSAVVPRLFPPLQGSESSSFCLVPRALPWADMLSPFGARPKRRNIKKR